MNKEQAILSKLNQKPLDSKKCVYAIYGSVCVLLVFSISAFLILNHAEASKEIVELANLVTMFFGAVVTTLITGTAVMDWKATSALQNIYEDQHIDSNAEAPEIQVNNTRLPRPKYFDHDGSI